MEPMASVSDPVKYPFFFSFYLVFFFFVFVCLISFLVYTYFNKGCFGNRALVFESGRTSDVVVLHRQLAMPPFLPSGKFCSLNTTINAQVIESTADISPLGVNIDEHLVFSKHTSELRIKASQRVGVLSRLRTH